MEMKTVSNGKEISETIIKQLGGRQFMYMVNSKDMVYDHNSLTMKISRNNTKGNYFRVTLRNDLYDLEFFSVRNLEKKVKKTIEGVEVSMLRNIFEEETGLYTSL